LAEVGATVLSTLRTTIVNQDGVVVLDGTALVWTEPL
jgi:hypothetical protein